MSLDETVELYRSVLDQLNMDTVAVAAFSDEAKAAQNHGQSSAPDNDRVSSQLQSHEYGYLPLKVAAIYRPRADQGFIKLMGSWQPKGVTGSWFACATASFGLLVQQCSASSSSADAVTHGLPK